MVVDALLDSWLLQHFSGRFLDEIDTQMDVFRFLKAIQARGIERIEQTRKDQIKGKIKAADISTDEWKQIKRHDLIMDRLIGDLA